MAIAVKPMWPISLIGVMPKFAATVCLFLSIVVIGASGKAWAQTGAPAPRFTLQGQADTSGGPVVRDGLGKPCLNIEAAARAQAVNPKILDHIVSVLNKCPRMIKMRLCYAGSTQCKEFEVRAYKRQDITLGSMMGVSYFKYTMTQK